MLIANTLAIILRCAFDGITANECGQFFTSISALWHSIHSVLCSNPAHSSPNYITLPKSLTQRNIT